MLVRLLPSESTAVLAMIGFSITRNWSSFTISSLAVVVGVLADWAMTAAGRRSRKGRRIFFMNRAIEITILQKKQT